MMTKLNGRARRAEASARNTKAAALIDARAELAAEREAFRKATRTTRPQLNHAVVNATATSATPDSPAAGSAVQVKGSKAGKSNPYTHDLDATQVKRLARGYRNAVVTGAAGVWLFCRDLSETIDSTKATYKTVALRLGPIDETFDKAGELTESKNLSESQISRFRSAYREGILPITDPKGLGIDSDIGPTSLYQCKAFRSRAYGNDTRTVAGKNATGKSAGARGSKASTPKTWTELCETMVRRACDSGIDRADVIAKVEALYDSAEEQVADDDDSTDTVSVAESHVDQVLATQLSRMLVAVG